MTAHEALVKARNLIADEKNWVQYVAASGPYCAIGAVAYADAIMRASRYEESLTALRTVIDDYRLGDWNDSHSHAEVLAAFDRAIAATAPKPDLSFLKDVRVEPERVA